MSDRKKLAVSLVVIYILIFALNYFTPLYADDYGYAFSFSSGERINNVLDIIPSMRAHYNMVNSRIITHSFAQLFLMMGKDVFSGINAFTFTAWLGILKLIILKHPQRVISVVKGFIANKLILNKNVIQSIIYRGSLGKIWVLSLIEHGKTILSGRRGMLYICYFGIQG